MTEWEQLGIAVTKQAVIDYIYCRKHLEKIKAGKARPTRRQGNADNWQMLMHPEETVKEIERYLRGPLFAAYSGKYGEFGEAVLVWLENNWRVFRVRLLKETGVSHNENTWRGKMPERKQKRARRWNTNG